MKRNKGDILQATNRSRVAGFHFIIFYEGYEDNEFLAGVITTTDKFPVNYVMQSNHFVEEDDNGKHYKITFKNSKLVPAKLFKPEQWGPFDKVGQLTAEGICFIEKHIGQLEPEYWEDYILK
jgi:hypothetical protein